MIRLRLAKMQKTKTFDFNLTKAVSLLAIETNRRKTHFIIAGYLRRCRIHLNKYVVVFFLYL